MRLSLKARGLLSDTDGISQSKVWQKSIGNVLIENQRSLLFNSEKDGSFNLYYNIRNKLMRNKLMSKGIFKEEIDFIHEADMFKKHLIKT